MTPVITPFRKSKVQRRCLPWGTVLLIALAFSGFSYATAGEAARFTAAFQPTEHTDRTLLNDTQDALAGTDPVQRLSAHALNFVHQQIINKTPVFRE